MQLVQKIRDFIISHLNTFEEDVVLKNDDNIFELGFVDSLFALQLVSYIDMEFKIEVNNEDLDISNFNSVDSIVAFIKNKQNS